MSGVSWWALESLLIADLSNAPGSTCYDRFDHFVEACSVFVEGREG